MLGDVIVTTTSAEKENADAFSHGVGHGLQKAKETMNRNCGGWLPAKKCPMIALVRRLEIPRRD